MNYLYVKDLLEGEYAEAFKRSEQYGMITVSDNKVFDDLMMNLADVLLTAQKKGKPVEKIIGKDTENFCTEYFDSVTPKERIRMAFKKLFYSFLSVFILQLLICLGDSGFLANSSNYFISFVIGFLSGSITEIIFSFVFKRLFVKYKTKVYKIYSFIQITTIILVTFISISCINRFGIAIPNYLGLIITGIYVIPYLAVMVYKKLKNGELFNNEERKQKRATKDAQQERETIKTWIKMFDSKNKRLAKKGKPLIAKEDYMKKLYKRHCYGTKERVLFLVFMACLLICFLVLAEFENGWWDRALFLLINLAVEIPIVRFFDRISLLNYGILQKCKEDGIDIFEYHERMNGNSGL